MHATGKIQSVGAVSHVANLCDYMWDAAHPRHADVVITDCIGLNCSSKEDFISSIRTAEARRKAKKKKLLSAKALHIMGGTTPGLILNSDERRVMLKMLLADVPIGLQVLVVYHEQKEVCEDFHILVSGYDAAGGDAAFRFPTDLFPQSYVRRQLDKAIAKIQSARSANTRLPTLSSTWQLNRKRRPKSLIEQLADASRTGLGMSTQDLIQDKLHFPVVAESTTAFKVITWYQIKPLYVSKNWKAQLEVSPQPTREAIHGLVEPAALKQTEELNLL